jgi:hypothetical protein
MDDIYISEESINELIIEHTVHYCIGEASVRKDEGFNGTATTGADRDEEERQWEGQHA